MLVRISIYILKSFRTVVLVLNHFTLQRLNLAYTVLDGFSFTGKECIFALWYRHATV